MLQDCSGATGRGRHPELLFGRVNVERSSAGTNLVITNPRPVNDPVVRLTIQAGCESAVRREYTLFMDPPAVEVPVVAAEAAPREAAVAPRPAPAAREPRRPVRPAVRSSTRAVASSGPESVSTVASKGPPADPAVDALAVSELSHATEEARVFVALGHPERAIEALQEHLRRHPRSMPAAWLMLLGLSSRDRKPRGISSTRRGFSRALQCADRTCGKPLTSDSAGTGRPRRFPHVEAQVVELWRSRDAAPIWSACSTTIAKVAGTDFRCPHTPTSCCWCRSSTRRRTSTSTGISPASASSVPLPRRLRLGAFGRPATATPVRTRRPMPPDPRPPGRCNSRFDSISSPRSPGASRKRSDAIGVPPHPRGGAIRALGGPAALTGRLHRAGCRGAPARRGASRATREGK